MRKLSIILLSVLFITATASAQKISGVIKDQQGKGLEKTTVSLLRGKDSSVIKLSVTDGDGRFSFQTGSGEFLVNASHVAYSPSFSQLITVANADVSAGEIFTVCPVGI